MRLARLPEESISLEAPFPALGLDSVKISTLQGRLRLTLGVDIDLVALIGHSIVSLAEAIIRGRSYESCTVVGGAVASTVSSPSPLRAARAPTNMYMYMYTYMCARTFGSSIAM